MTIMILCAYPGADVELTDERRHPLYIGKTAPYPEQETEVVEYGVMARLNPKTKEVENLEVLFFNQRLAGGVSLRLPILAEFQLPRAGEQVATGSPSSVV